ncbi:MAG: uracil phosphoribosyltransferase [Alphaproteobacteria bacterium]|nr:uracil phosphoribosyltransferase [Alphaproteobacteria bacterium]
MYKHQDFKNLHVVDHPLVLDRLSQMRCKETPTQDFRRLLREIAMFMGYEVTKDIPLTTKKIETPICEMEAPVLSHPEPVLVPILRAGLGMSDGLKDLLTNAVFGHIGVYRDEETHRPVEYLVRLPQNIGPREVILVDPMLATGHSAKYALDLLAREGVPQKQIRFMVLVAAPEGVKVIEEAYPDIPVYVAALDEKLNENAYIVPGLGDAGDRVFGTL